jgi:hypothetical protein
LTDISPGPSPSVKQLVHFPGWTRFAADRLGKVSHFHERWVSSLRNHLRGPSYDD